MRRWMNSSPDRGALRLLAVAFALAGAAGLAHAQTGGLPGTVDLGSPPNAALGDPANVALSLSVEWPTVGAAYRDSAYVHDLVDSPYLGYWDIHSCYEYQETGTGALAGGYFTRKGATDAQGYCASTYYSGNLLNYVAASAIDILRLALTGGHRVVDTPTQTVLERAYLYNGWKLNNPSHFPRRSIHKNYWGKVLPHPGNLASGNYVYAGSCKDKIWFGTNQGNNADCDSPGTSHSNLNPSTTSGWGSNKTTTYHPMYARVEVCTSAEALVRADLCERYPSGGYKPVGQIQKKSEGTRLAAFGYLMDDSQSRYGGVLRAPMGYVGPTMPSAGGFVENAQREWNASTGVFVNNPRDASGFTYSGVINYVNRFGTTGTKGEYKELDPVGELYYETLRYFMGLGPTAKATQGMSANPEMKDGYPVYTSWDDPVQNACQRKNYILTIGDVNTHWDKELPGHGSPLETSVDKGRSAESLKGGGTFNAKDWTDIIAKFETNASGTYKNSLGATVSTQGNPDPKSSNSGLATKATGAGSRSAYYWAGAAYWAHTQPIRNDTKDGLSMSDVRVNTFTIDVDEGGNGLIGDDNPRSIKPRRSSFYLAGKYGWFLNTDETGMMALEPLETEDGELIDLDGHPFRNVLTGELDNSRWEYAGEPNTPDGYVIASQAQKMLDGVARFFNSLEDTVTPAAVTGLSSVNFSTVTPDGDSFVPQFEPRNWSGRLLKATMTLEQATGKIKIGDVDWEAGEILTDASIAIGTVADPFVKPEDRQLFTYSRDPAYRGGQIFSVAQKNRFDAAVLNSLKTRFTSTPTSLSDAEVQDATINWLRGDRSLEAGATSGFLRARTSVLGAMVNSGPVYKRGVDDDPTGDGFPEFAAAVQDRTPMVYVGADDGFLHAFRAEDGKELFAYMPRAVAEAAHELAAPDYVHRPYVDAEPLVSEAQRRDASGDPQWRTLLVSGMGGGAQGVFALDVTDPDDFGTDNVLFEFTDRDDPDMGNVLTPPKFVRVKMASAGGNAEPEYRWFVAVGSGYNNYQADGHRSTDGRQAMFLLSLDKPVDANWQENVNYFKMKVGMPVGGLPAALVNPGVAKDVPGNTILLYAADTQGNLWKFDLRAGLNATNAAAAVSKLAELKDEDNSVQMVTTVPQVVPALGNGYIVIFGTGKYLEAGDADLEGGNSVYGIRDNLDAEAGTIIDRSMLFGRAFDAETNLTTGNQAFRYANPGDEESEDVYHGWYVDLPYEGERVVVNPDTRFGYTAVNSLVPPADCSVHGTGALMTFDNIYGFARSARDYRLQAVGAPRIVALDLSEEDAYTYSSRSATGRRDLVMRSSAISGVAGSGGKPGVAQNPIVSMTVPAGRVGWREVKNFEKVEE